MLSLGKNITLMKKLILGLGIILFMVGCSDLPNDLQDKKDMINDKYTNLQEYEKGASTSLEYGYLLREYTELKDRIIKHTEERNDRGFAVNNNEVVSDVEEKRVKYERLFEAAYEAKRNKHIPIGYKKGGRCYDCNGKGYGIDTNYDYEMVCPGCNGTGYRWVKK